MAEELPTLRYFGDGLTDGELMCLHCGEYFEDWDMVPDRLVELELDAEGFNRDWPEKKHPTTDCGACGKLLVWGRGEGTLPYYVRGRSPADLRYLKEKKID